MGTPQEDMTSRRSHNTLDGAKKSKITQAPVPQIFTASHKFGKSLKTAPPFRRGGCELP
jgi:hypothetical protein